MEAWQQLRLAARNKRDAAIRAARNAYHSELQAIQKLRNSLEGITPCRGAPAQGVGPKRRTIADLVRDALPESGQFTVAGIVAKVRAVDANRRYRRDSMRTLFAQLRREGLIQRVKRVGKGHVIWESLPPPEKPPTPFEVLALPDAIAIVLAERGPLRVPEITVALQDRGYRVDAKQRVLQDSVRAAVRRCGERFKVAGDRRWALQLTDCQ